MTPIRTGGRLIRGGAAVLATVGLVSSFALPARATGPRLSPLRASSAWEQLPAGGSGFLLWSQNSTDQPDHFDLYARPRHGTAFRVNPPRSQAYAGGLRGSVLVYQLIKGRHSDLRMYDLATRHGWNPPAGVNTSHEESAPSMSGSWLLFTRKLTEHWPVYKVLLFNLTTHRTLRLAVVRGPHVYAAAGQVNGDYATWQECTDHVKCQVFRYRISTDRILPVPNPNTYQYAPSVARDGTVFFARSGSACGANVRLMRYRGLASPHLVVALPTGIDVGDTYVVRDGYGEEHLLYDHTSCDPFTADIYRVPLG
jgi:hypothetical protein